MAGYRLCRVKTAENPFFIENISTNIYSIEELCYFFVGNVPLIDATVMNSRLTAWVANELGLPKLSLKMEHAISGKNGILEFVGVAFSEIGYLSQSEFNRYAENLNAFLSLPGPMKMKLKGDSLCRVGKYTAATRVYREILDDDDGEMEGMESREAFLGAVWHNRGVAEMKLMLFDEGLASFRRSMKMRPTRRHAISYVEALGITRPREKYTEEITAFREYLKGFNDGSDVGEDAIYEAEEILEVARKGIEVDIPADIYGYVQDLAKEYHASAGA
ncbi:MAG: hypothetical protein Q4A32_04280 [Lachnospiraceae bacterium]|nr:hypothetical protein [Lachnospiraceae bacterium]